MTYEEKKKLIEAAKVLKEWCTGRPCEGCIFENDSELTCAVRYNSPSVWEIPTLTRWTPEDVALAKALKAFGVKYIDRYSVGVVEAFDEGGDSVLLIGAQANAFKSIDEYKRIDLDTIIKEAEE